MGFNTQDFQPGLTVLDDIDEVPSNLTIHELNNLTEVISFNSNNLYFYVEDYYQVHKNLKVDLGFRYHYFSGQNKSYNQYEPRALINYTLSKKSHFFASASIISQPLHLINNVTLRLPTDLWLPSSDNIKPQQATIFNLGFNYRFTDNINLRFEGYSKKINNLYTYQEDLSFDSNLNSLEPSEYLDRGNGFVKGMEFSLDMKEENFGFMSSYTLSKSDRQFDNINENIKYPFEFDHRHQVKLFSYFKFNRNIILNLSYNYASGKPTARNFKKFYKQCTYFL